MWPDIAAFGGGPITCARTTALGGCADTRPFPARAEAQALSRELGCLTCARALSRGVEAERTGRGGLSLLFPARAHAQALCGWQGFLTCARALSQGGVAGRTGRDGLSLLATCNVMATGAGRGRRRCALGFRFTTVLRRLRSAPLTKGIAIASLSAALLVIVTAVVATPPSTTVTAVAIIDVKVRSSTRGGGQESGHVLVWGQGLSNRQTDTHTHLLPSL